MLLLTIIIIGFCVGVYQHIEKQRYLRAKRMDMRGVQVPRQPSPREDSA